VQFLTLLLAPVPPVPPWIQYMVGGDISQILSAFGV
jgi:hypothetical protein